MYTTIQNKILKIKKRVAGGGKSLFLDKVEERFFEIQEQIKENIAINPKKKMPAYEG